MIRFMQDLLFFVHYGLLLLFGVVLSISFAGVKMPSIKNILISLSLFIVCSLLQLFAFLQFGENLVWMLYPLISHLPIFLVLCLYYRKNPLSVLSAISTAYLCCQPAKWLGLLTFALTENEILELIVRMTVLLAVGAVSLIFISPVLSKLFEKDIKSVLIFGSVPIIYYLFDYIMGIYTDLWITHNRVVAEFLPFFLCIVFMVFCLFYYKEYEQKLDAKHTQEIIRIKSEQQAKEVEALKRSEHEIRLIRHDMHSVLNTVSLCIQEKNYAKAEELLSTLNSRIEGTKLKQFCEVDTVNYVVSHYVTRCEAESISFSCDVAVTDCRVDEVMLCSIVSNLLDNAINAQAELPMGQRKIEFMFKNFEGKILISVKNPIKNMPPFANGLPITENAGHGYGAQSVRYMTEKLGGNCQFSAKNKMFIARVII